ncbi:MAG: YqzL family protein [Clostridia bacterium]|nr:YqzL family protein [Clostridia bacterium]
MEAKDLMWKMFYETGNVNHYLLYNQLENKKGGPLHGPDKNKGNSSAEHSVWRPRQNAHSAWRNDG